MSREVLNATQLEPIIQSRTSGFKHQMTKVRTLSHYFNASGNIFSTVLGLVFEWAVVAPRDVSNSQVEVISIVSFKDINMLNTPELLLEMGVLSSKEEGTPS